MRLTTDHDQSADPARPWFSRLLGTVLYLEGQDLPRRGSETKPIATGQDNMDAASYKDHAIFSAIDTTLEHLNEVEKKTPANYKEYSDRIRAVGSYLKSFRSTPGSLFSPQMLDQIYSQWNQVDAVVTNHKASPEAGHLPQSSAFLDACLTSVASWPQPRGAVGQKAAEFIESMGETSSQTVEALKEEIERAGEAADEAESQRVALAQKLTALDAKITQDETRLDNAVTTQVEGFNNAQTKREETFVDWLASRRQEYDSEVSEYKHLLTEETASAEVILLHLKDLRDKTERVAGEATSARLARDYGVEAEREFKYAIGSYAIGLTLTVLAGCFLFVTIGGLKPEEPVSWQYVSLKIGLSAILIGAATVAFTLGHRFLQSSSTNKRIELELAALGPFLADVEEDDEGTVRRAKLDFMERTFGRTWDVTQQPADDSVNASAFAKMVDSVARLASRGQ